MKYTNDMGYLISIIFLITLYQYFLHLPVAANTGDVLIPGDVLNSSDDKSTLASSNGIFTLGFFKVKQTNFTYLGIRFTDNEDVSKVWIANRDTPVIGNGLLKIEDSGTLKVVNESGITLFNVFYNPIGSGNQTRAVLNNSGNFIIYDNNNRILWQSFDHPTDALIYGMKLGYNLTTKQNWTLTSSLSNQIPSTGVFTMRLEQYNNSPQLLIYRREELYWASGPWENNNRNSLLKFFPIHDLVSDPSGMYILCSTDGTAASSLHLTPTGQLTDGRAFAIYTEVSCYESRFDYDDGCTYSGSPHCRDKRDYRWGSGYYETLTEAYKYDDNPNISISDCIERCWNDCKCEGCSTYSNGTGCIYWTGGHADSFSYDPTVGNAYVLISDEDYKIKTWKWIVASLAGVLISVITAYLCYVMIRRCRLKGVAKREIKKRDDFIQQLIGSNSFNFGEELEKGFKDAPEVKIFSLKAILTATNNFSNDNKLGQGGYGPVYRGELTDGRKIAVKKLSKTSGQGILEFKSELILISKLQHTNLVRLYGCCIHHEEKMLIYEFMPNKSLDFFLFDNDKKKKIDWRIRLNIIEGVAQGLLYLHKYSRMKIIHRDLKVSNVLLDENMNPKIADFGMAKIFQSNITEGSTNRVVGTYGYMAPEYAIHGTFSIKSDVFSFGVLVLEILSGKKNSSFYKYDNPVTLIGYAWELWKRDAIIEFKDIAIGESYDVKQLLRNIHVGLLCVQENANDRPTMSEVIYMLNNENLDLPIPKQPAFYTQPNDVQLSNSDEHILGNNIQVSVNSLTLTTMEAR